MSSLRRRCRRRARCLLRVRYERSRCSHLAIGGFLSRVFARVESALAPVPEPLLGLALLVLAAVVAVVAGGRTNAPPATGSAPNFTVASSGGRKVLLSDLRGRSVLPYFNEGIGCDACFCQTAVLEDDEAFRQLDVPLVPIVVNPTSQLRGELDRFAIATPHLSDPDGSISSAYGTLGRGHHADLPGTASSSSVPTARSADGATTRACGSNPPRSYPRSALFGDAVEDEEAR